MFVLRSDLQARRFNVSQTRSICMNGIICMRNGVVSKRDSTIDMEYDGDGVMFAR